MVVNLSPRQIFVANIYIILFLLCANIIGIVFRLYLGHPYVHGLVPLFDFDSESNVPTLYSSITLIICSALLFIIGLNCKKNKSSYGHWVGLSLIFVYLSIDEINAIHEKLTTPLRRMFQASGYLHYAWVIPYGISLLVLVVVYSGFLLKLPRNTSLLFLASGAIYVLGEIGFELLGGRQEELFGKNNILYAFYYTCEEFLGMLGIALFIYALLAYIANKSEALIISVSKNKLE